MLICIKPLISSDIIVISTKYDDISGFIQINMADLENLVGITVISDDISGFIQINMADLENLVEIITK
jgi:hypothetical protein